MGDLFLNRLSASASFDDIVRQNCANGFHLRFCHKDAVSGAGDDTITRNSPAGEFTLWLGLRKAPRGGTKDHQTKRKRQVLQVRRKQNMIPFKSTVRAVTAYANIFGRRLKSTREISA